jgi:hypothetical protein
MVAIADYGRNVCDYPGGLVCSLNLLVALTMAKGVNIMEAQGL